MVILSLVVLVDVSRLGLYKDRYLLCHVIETVHLDHPSDLFLV